MSEKMGKVGGALSNESVVLKEGFEFLERIYYGLGADDEELLEMIKTGDIDQLFIFLISESSEEDNAVTAKRMSKKIMEKQGDLEMH